MISRLIYAFRLDFLSRLLETYSILFTIASSRSWLSAFMAGSISQTLNVIGEFEWEISVSILEASFVVQCT